MTSMELLVTTPISVEHLTGTSEKHDTAVAVSQTQRWRSKTLGCINKETVFFTLLSLEMSVLNSCPSIHPCVPLFLSLSIFTISINGLLFLLQYGVSTAIPVALLLRRDSDQGK